MIAWFMMGMVCTILTCGVLYLEGTDKFDITHIILMIALGPLTIVICAIIMLDL